jgi:tetratricopeptide (TPR) repeat protein
MTAVSFGINAQQFIQKSREELLSDKYYDGHFSHNYKGRTIASKPYYDAAINSYKAGDINGSIKNIEMALSVFTFGVYFYVYGDYLTETLDYRSAEKAYKKAIVSFQYENPYKAESNTGHSYGESFERQLFSFDSNGVARELYFAYYNLACLYSLQNNHEESLENIILAIQHGYPYIDHISRDSDLLNLFNSSIGSDARSRINQTYKEGFELKPNIQNKVFALPGGLDEKDYEFHGNGTVEKEYLAWNLLDYVKHGTYEIKNWMIIIHWIYEDGRRGVEGTEVWNGGADQTMYSEYEYFRYNLTNEIEIIPYMELTSQWKTPLRDWEQRTRRGYN